MTTRRIVGIDLGVRSSHTVVVIDETTTGLARRRCRPTRQGLATIEQAALAGAPAEHDPGCFMLIERVAAVLIERVVVSPSYRQSTSRDPGVQGGPPLHPRSPVAHRLRRWDRVPHRRGPSGLGEGNEFPTDPSRVLQPPPSAPSPRISHRRHEPQAWSRCPPRLRRSRPPCHQPVPDRGDIVVQLDARLADGEVM